MPNETTQGEDLGAMRARVVHEPKPEIQRGAMLVPCEASLGPAWSNDGLLTFERRAGRCTLVYHDVQIISRNAAGINVFVGPHDVVTWEVA